MPLFRKKQPPAPPAQPPTVIVKLEQPQPQEVHVKEHRRHIPFIERPQDGEARTAIRQAKLRKKLQRKGLLPTPETEIEKTAKEAEDLSSILSEARERQRRFDET